MNRSYGPPAASQSTYGAPNHGHGGSSGSIAQGHSSFSSHESRGQSSGIVINVPDSYGAPPPPQDSYGVPPADSYGAPSAQGPIDIPTGAYDAPSVHPLSETHEDISSHGGDIQTIQSIGQELQLPSVSNSGPQFNSAIGLVTSSLGVSAGNNEVVQSHAIHESHTSEVSLELF